MSKYTTGEIAKLCGVSVRTVQYYDTREILIPSELSEGGRRLYSEEDLKKMKIICFLRELDIPINSIGDLLREEHPERVIDLLLEQQERTLGEELRERREKLGKVSELRKELKGVEHFSVQAIGDIAYLMENKKKMKKLRGVILAGGIAMELIELAALVVAILTGRWWLPVAAFALSLVVGLLIVRYYVARVAYICPECHEVFRPGYWEVLWARHTPRTRKLTCSKCGFKGFCVETYGGQLEPKA